MILFRLFYVFVVALSLCSQVTAKTSDQNFYRSFWAPSYHGSRLNYCSIDNKACGLPIANQYCHLMGYKGADQQIIAHNVGLTHFISSKGHCKGWSCDGFKLIRCVGHMTHKPAKAYLYRSEEFVFPRFDHYRVAWCYENSKGCGQRAAYSFCRRLGYMKTTQFKIQEHVAATKAIGDQELCFGQACNGFSSITCYR